MNTKDHVALGIGEDGVGIGWHIIEEVTCLSHGVFGGGGLG